jgi:hypothetical protein
MIYYLTEFNLINVILKLSSSDEEANTHLARSPCFYSKEKLKKF